MADVCYSSMMIQPCCGQSVVAWMRHTILRRPPLAVIALRLMDEQAPFACVVSDMKMPQMDGVELVTRIKQRWQGMACIILTGNQDEATITRANEIARVDVCCINRVHAMN